MRYCTECELNGTDECPVKALSKRIGKEIVPEGCTEWAVKEEGVEDE